MTLDLVLQESEIFICIKTLDFLDTGKIQMGNSDDLQIYHDGSLNIIDCVNGTFS